MITLDHAPRTRSSRFIWLLAELGESYQLERVIFAREDGSDVPDPRNGRSHSNSGVSGKGRKR